MRRDRMEEQPQMAGKRPVDRMGKLLKRKIRRKKARQKMLYRKAVFCYNHGRKL